MWKRSNYESPKSAVWPDAPEMAIPDGPTLLYDTDDLWLCYATAPPSSNRFAIVHFMNVVDHRLAPINDEGLGQHPYAKSGLTFYAFHEIAGSSETLKWPTLKLRHWIVTFKDNTLDVVAKIAQVAARNLEASGPTWALMNFLFNRTTE